MIQPAFYTSKPTAGTADPADIALILKAGAYAQVPVSTLGGSATQAQIWSTRLRSFNSVMNPNFEVDQRNAGAGLTNPASGIFVQDRWLQFKAGTLSANFTRPPSGPGVVVPGTTFRLSASSLLATLTTQQASLGTSDSLQISQYVEGSQMRELINDVHSISLLVFSSVAGLNFSVSLRDSPVTKSLVKLCTIPSANTWTLITLSNLPVFPSGNFQVFPGAVGYQLTIALAAGTTLIAPAADTWQNGNFIGAPGMSNWANSPVNSTFYAAMVQHEPGGVCSTFMDKPFSQNLDEALRYFSKSYDYETAVGTAAALGTSIFQQNLTNQINGSLKFPKPMAKNPTVTIYNHASGAINSFTHSNATSYAVSTVPNIGKTGFAGINPSTAMPAVVAGAYGTFHYIADTGW